MPLETVDITKVAPQSPVLRERPRSAWPWMFAAALVLWATSSVFRLGASVTLVAAGIGGALGAILLIPSMRRMAWRINPGSWRIVLGLWITLCLALCVSFVISGMQHVAAGKADLGLAEAELRTTIFALVLCGTWIALIRLPGRPSPSYQVATTLSVLEAGRLIAFRLDPSIWSLLVWVVAVFCAWSRFVHRSSRIV